MNLPAWITGHLACPRCRSPLAFGAAPSRCANCQLEFPGPSGTSIDLRGDREPDPGWRSRQQYMEREYDQLLDDGDHAARAFQNDYRTIAGILHECEGRILDVGGGTGVTREWLPSDENYVLLEPSDLWSDSRWRRWTGSFPCFTRPTVCIRGFAEALPFTAGTFDIVLHLWTLNHVADVALSVSEGLRVLRRDGRFVAVLEEARPTWHDLRTRRAGATLRQHLQDARQTLAAMLRPPPLQPDHVAVDEKVLTRAARARLFSRDRVGPYLAIVLEKTD